VRRGSDEATPFRFDRGIRIFFLFRMLSCPLLPSPLFKGTKSLAPRLPVSLAGIVTFLPGPLESPSFARLLSLAAGFGVEVISPGQQRPPVSGVLPSHLLPVSTGVPTHEHRAPSLLSHREHFFHLPHFSWLPVSYKYAPLWRLVAF